MSRITVASCLFVLLTACAQTVPAGDLGVGVVFSHDEIMIIAAWYEEKGPKLGGNPKKAKGLPPGIAKNLARGKPLPPGIAKQYLPDGLIARLPPPPHGYERVIVDGRILLVEIATRVIHDILVDIVLN